MSENRDFQTEYDPWFFHGIDRLEQLPLDLFECKVCGAIMSDWLRHSIWHDGLNGRADV